MNGSGEIVIVVIVIVIIIIIIIIVVVLTAWPGTSELISGGHVPCAVWHLKLTVVHSYATSVADAPEGTEADCVVEMSTDDCDPTVKPPTKTALFKMTSSSSMLSIGEQGPGPTQVKGSDAARKAPSWPPGMPQICESGPSSKCETRRDKARQDTKEKKPNTTTTTIIII